MKKTKKTPNIDFFLQTIVSTKNDDFDKRVEKAKKIINKMMIGDVNVLIGAMMDIYKDVNRGVKI